MINVVISDEEVLNSESYKHLRKISKASDERVLELIKESMSIARRKQIIEQLQSLCSHESKTFSHTYDDWYDGDSDDIYYCDNCGKKIIEYQGR